MAKRQTTQWPKQTDNTMAKRQTTQWPHNKYENMIFLFKARSNASLFYVLT
jgi:hypothetical protein